jgi:hypothetical protein
MKLTEKIKRRIMACESSTFELCANLHDEDIPELVEILQKKPNIQYLDLSSNKIEQAGAINLSQLKHLIYLDISSNNITNEAVLELLLNENLISLNCSSNPLLDNKLAHAILAKKTHQTTLVFDRTKISGDMLRSIDKMCSLNKEIRDKISFSKSQDECKESDSASSIISSNSESSTLTPAEVVRIDSKSTEQIIEKSALINSNSLFAFFKSLSCRKEKNSEAQRTHTPSLT